MLKVNYAGKKSEHFSSCKDNENETLIKQCKGCKLKYGNQLFIFFNK